MSSAWLIRRFIDPHARFAFADRPVPDQIAFDMFEGDFTHQGDACTFEVLVRRFRIADPAVERIAAIVHDLDLKDSRHEAQEAATIGLLIDGIQESQPDDGRRLETGIAVFESLYAAFAAGARQWPARGESPRKRRSGKPAATSRRRGTAKRKR